MAETRNILDFEKFSVRFDEWLGRDEQSHSELSLFSRGTYITIFPFLFIAEILLDNFISRELWINLFINVQQM